MTQYLPAANGFSELSYDSETKKIHRWPIVGWRIEHGGPIPITVVGTPNHEFIWIQSPDGLITYNSESPAFTSIEEWRRHMVEGCYM